MRGWTSIDIPDLTGKLIVVTGGNSGIGFEAARAFAAHGAQLVLACRDVKKAEEAAARIREQTPAAKIDVMALDLARLASVRDFATAFKAKYPKLDVLLNNAGVMAIPPRKTADGFEMQFGTNHLGHFALTAQLLDSLVASGSGRVVNVSSGAHRWGRIALDDLNSEKHYSKWRVYGQSKLANLLFTFELQRKLAAAGLPVIAVAVHPGYAATNLQFAGPRMQASKAGEWFMNLGNKLFAQSAEAGAWPSEYAVSMPDVKGGDYWGSGDFMEMRGPPKRCDTTPAAKDTQMAAALWKASESMTGVPFTRLAAKA